MADLEIIWPNYPHINSAFSPTFRQLSQNDNNVFTVGFMPKATTITEVRIRLGTITDNGGTIRVGLMGVSTADGTPTGTWLNNGTNDVYTDIAVSGLTAAAWRTVDIPNYTCARGEVIGIMVQALNNGSWSTTTVNVSSGWNNADNFPSTPWTSHRIGGATTQTLQNSFAPHSFPRDANQAFWSPQNDLTLGVIESDAGNQLVGALFSLPSGMASTYKISGIKFNGRRNQANAAMDMILYDSSGSVLQSVSIDADLLTRTASTSQMWSSMLYFDESSLTTLNTGTQYRLVLKPTTTNQISVYNYTFDLATDKAAYCGLDSTYDLTTNAGTDPTTGWTNTSTAMPPFSLIVTDISSTTGGLLVHPGMAGGMRG